MRLSPLQMTDATAWKGLTTENHLGAIWQQSPQKASDIISLIQQKTFGNDIDGLLSKFETKEFDSDLPYTWDLMSQGLDNIPLVECRIDGTAITSASQAGLNNTEFQLVFAKDWFSEGERIVGELNEKYPIRIKRPGTPDGSYTVYDCEMDSGNPDLFLPYEECSGGQLFSREFAPVERTLSEVGREIKFQSTVSMRNEFSQIRIQKSTPGNLKNRKMGTYLKSGNQIFKMWQQYESFMFDREFREDISRLLMFGTSNKTETGDYIQKGRSGYQIVEGSGLREQCEASNTSFYNSFDIEFLAERLLDLSEGKLGFDERSFVATTGERGAYQFSKSLENYSQLFIPTRETERIYNTNAEYAKKGLGYGGQFVEYVGPNKCQFNLSVNSMYDNRNRNKKYHADGGVTESYRYDIYDVGTSDGEPNIRKVKVRGLDVIHRYIPGLRNPFDPDGGLNTGSSMIANPKDGWEEHKYYCGGVMVKDPSRTAAFIPNEV